MSKPFIKTSWVPFGGGLLVTSDKQEHKKGKIIIPDSAQATAHGVVQKASAPSTLYFHPGDEIIFHLQGSVDIELPDCEEQAFLVMPKAVMMHLPKKRKGAEII